MKRILSFMMLLTLVQMSFGQDESAATIIQKAEDRLRGTTMYAEMTITTIRPKWTREMKVKT